jgi:hypothetical protein
MESAVLPFERLIVPLPTLPARVPTAFEAEFRSYVPPDPISSSPDAAVRTALDPCVAVAVVLRVRTPVALIVTELLNVIPPDPPINSRLPGLVTFESALVDPVLNIFASTSRELVSDVFPITNVPAWTSFKVATGKSRSPDVEPPMSMPTDAK